MKVSTILTVVFCALMPYAFASSENSDTSTTTFDDSVSSHHVDDNTSTTTFDDNVSSHHVDDRTVDTLSKTVHYGDITFSNGKNKNQNALSMLSFINAFII